MIELLRAGHDVSIVCPRGHSSEKVRAAHHTFPYKPFSALASLAKAIEATGPDILIPFDDMAIRHLHQLHASERAYSKINIPALIACSMGDPLSFSVVASRQKLLKIAREEGILAPETTVVCSIQDLNKLLRDKPFPWVLKVDGSFGGAGVRIASTLAEGRDHYADLGRSIGLLQVIKRLIVNDDTFLAMQWWDEVRGFRPEVVAQSFIRGRPANCAVFCWNGEIHAGVGCEVVSDQAALGPASVVRLVDNADMMAAAAKIARRLKLSGFFGLDFMIEEETGSTFLIEMNPRCTQLCHLRLGPARDMIGALSAVLTGRRPGEEASITQNNLIAYFPRALFTGSNFLSSSYHDAPWGEPELIQELIRAELGMLRKEKQVRMR